MFTELERDLLLFICRTRKSTTETQLLDDDWQITARENLELEVEVLESIIAKVASVHTMIYTKYIPVWVDKDAKTGRGFGYNTPKECEAKFNERVSAGLNDVSYKIEVEVVYQYVASTQPKANQPEHINNVSDRS